MPFDLKPQVSELTIPTKPPNPSNSGQKGGVGVELLEPADTVLWGHDDAIGRLQTSTAKPTARFRASVSSAMVIYLAHMVAQS